MNVNFWSIFGQTTKVIALCFGQKWLIFITFQSAIKMSEWLWLIMAHYWSMFGQNTKVIALLFGYKWLIFITCQSAIKMSECQDFWANYQGYSLNFGLWSICNQNGEFQFWSFLAKYQGYSLTFWPKMAHFHHFSICNQNE